MEQLNQTTRSSTSSSRITPLEFSKTPSSTSWTVPSGSVVSSVGASPNRYSSAGPPSPNNAVAKTAPRPSSGQSNSSSRWSRSRGTQPPDSPWHGLGDASPPRLLTGSPTLPIANASTQLRGGPSRFH